jgi:hypothetical protein
MYQQYNPFLQPYQPQQRGMDNYMQDVQSSQAMQGMDPRLQQEAMRRQQIDFQNYMQQQQLQQQRMQQNPFASLSQQQQEVLGQFGYQPDMAQQPSPNFGPQQPDPSRVDPGPNADPMPQGQPSGFRQGGNQWGAGGPSQMLRGPAGGNPMHPGARQSPQQHWTPPSVNMPIHQRDQPWMGGQSQLAAQYGGQNFGAQREYQGNPFAQQARRGGSTNPFQRRGSQPAQNLGVREMRTEPRKPTGPQPSPATPPSGGSRGRGNSGLAPIPGSGFNPFDQMSQQRQPPVIPSFNSR